MENLQPIFQAYDMSPRLIQRVKSVWKVTTEHGYFALKKVNASIPQLDFIHQSIMHLNQAGFAGVVPFKHTKDGYPYLSLHDEIYYVTPWVEGVTGSSLLNQIDWIPQTFSQLGKMHRISIGKHRDQLEELYSEGMRLQENWNNRISRLQEFRELVSKRVYPSPVDVAFMANMDQLMEMSIEATGRLEEWLNTTQEKQEIRLTFCHGRINPEHIVMQRELSFINFDHANMDFPARDLSYLIRYLATRMGSSAMIEDWLNRYVNENPLTKEEIEILNISLQFPVVLAQFLERYYTDQLKGKWTEFTLIRRFEKMLHEQTLLTTI